MHWLCFHLEFEHENEDPDKACNDARCPWNQISHLREILEIYDIDIDVELGKIWEKKGFFLEIFYIFPLLPELYDCSNFVIKNS